MTVHAKIFKTKQDEIRIQIQQYEKSLLKFLNGKVSIVSKINVTT